MRADPHHCRLLASPWTEVYATDIDSARHYGRHWHGTYGLGVIDGGAHRSASGRGAVDAFAGDIVTTNPGEVHDGRPLGAPSRRWRTVYLAPEIVATVQAEAGRGGGDFAFARAAFRDEPLRRSLLHLLDCLQAWSNDRQRDRAANLACEEALVHTCGLALRGPRQPEAPPSPRPDAALHRVLQRLADAPLAAPGLDELAALAGLGKFQLLRRFCRALGTTPHAWLLQHRAEVARGLISQGHALSAAAADAGFADQSHLTRVFVRCYGFTPGVWQRAVAPARQRAAPQ